MKSRLASLAFCVLAIIALTTVAHPSNGHDAHSEDEVIVMDVMTACEDTQVPVSAGDLLKLQLEERLIRGIDKRIHDPPLEAAFRHSTHLPQRRRDGDVLEVIFLNDWASDTRRSLNWITNGLLAKLDMPYSVSIQDLENVIGVNNSLIVTTQSLSEYATLLHDAVPDANARRHLSVGLLHLGDSNCHGSDAYAHFSYVLRAYACPQWTEGQSSQPTHPPTPPPEPSAHVPDGRAAPASPPLPPSRKDGPVWTIPVGWHIPPFAVVPRSSQRELAVAFIGQSKFRDPLMDMLHGAELADVPKYVFEIPDFYHPSHPSPTEIMTVLMKSSFVLCPPVNTRETPRVYEALEAGAIPVLQSTAILNKRIFGGDVPFLSVVSWKDAAFLIRALRKDPQRLDQLQKRCVDWWEAYKSSMQENVASLISNA